MGDINELGIKANRKKIRVHNEEFFALMKAPFDLKDPDHIATIEKYNASFALTVNKMYLYQAMNEGFNKWVWGISLGTRFLLPIPEFISTLSNYYLCLTAIGAFLQSTGTTDFLAELEEMEILYIWALKNGKDTFTAAPTDKLNHPAIQEMMKLLAPLCNPDFIRVWPKVTEQNETRGTLSAFFNVANKTYSGFFATVPAPSERLKPLQVQIETNGLAMNSFDAGAHAIRYFVTNEQFREKMKAYLPMDTLRAIGNLLPAALNTAGHLKHN